MDIELPYLQIYADVLGVRGDTANFVRILEKMSHKYAEMGNGEGFVELGTYLQSRQINDLALKSFVSAWQCEEGNIEAANQIIQICSKTYLHLTKDNWKFPEVWSEDYDEDILIMNDFTLLFYVLFKLSNSNVLQFKWLQEIQSLFLKIFIDDQLLANHEFCTAARKYIEHCSYDDHILSYVLKIPLLQKFDASYCRREILEKIESNYFGNKELFTFLLDDSNDDSVPQNIFFHKNILECINLISNNLCANDVEPYFIQDAIYTLQNGIHSQISTSEIWSRLVLAYGLATKIPEKRAKLTEYALHYTFELVKKHNRNPLPGSCLCG